MKTSERLDELEKIVEQLVGAVEQFDRMIRGRILVAIGASELCDCPACQAKRAAAEAEEVTLKH